MTLFKLEKVTGGPKQSRTGKFTYGDMYTWGKCCVTADGA